MYFKLRHAQERLGNGEGQTAVIQYQAEVLAISISCNYSSLVLFPTVLKNGFVTMEITVFCLLLDLSVALLHFCKILILVPIFFSYSPTVVSHHSVMLQELLQIYSVCPSGCYTECISWRTRGTWSL